MVRERRLVSRGHGIVAALLSALLGSAAAQSPSETAPKTETPTKPETALKTETAPKAAPLPLDRQPYRIRVLLSSHPSARIDAPRRAALVDDWLTLVHRFVGAPWVVSVADESASAAAAAGVAQLVPGELRDASKDVDKVWVVRLDAEGSGLSFVGREFDVATGRVGPLQHRVAAVVRDAPRVFLKFAFDLFAPYAEIGERFGKSVSLTIRAASLSPATDLGRVAPEGTVFLPLRVVPQKDGPTLVREIPFTFLRVEAAATGGAKCAVVSVYSDPFTRRVVQKSTLQALGVKPGKSPSRLRFQTLPDKAPAAGYVLTARNFPDGLPRNIGTTDRAGRVTIDPTPFDGLVVLRLLAGSTEPMLEFPFMPGAAADERTIPPFDPKPLAVELEAKLDALRDSVIDLIAVRARLEARLKARYDGEDYAAAAEVLDEFHRLPPADKFTKEIQRLHDEAVRRQTETKSAVLTKTAQAQFADLQALVDRYLDDEAFKGFAEGLAKMKAEPAAKADKKAAAKK